MLVSLYLKQCVILLTGFDENKMFRFEIWRDLPLRTMKGLGPLEPEVGVPKFT